MLEFKLEYYFNLYKDTIVVSTAKFKDVFIKKHGDFELLPELINMIQKYQYKKYGNLLQTGKVITRNVKKDTFNRREYARNRNKFGTREDRIKRKLGELHK